MRWSSNSSLIAAVRPAELFLSTPGSRSSGSGPSALNGGHWSGSSVRTRSRDPNRRASLKRDPPPLVGFEQQMVVLGDSAGIDAPVPGHAEMEDERVAAVGVDQTVFRAAPKPVTARPVSRWPRSTGRARGPAAVPRRGEAAPFEHTRKAADGGLDFGKLRHRGAIWRTALKPARAAAR